MCCAGTGCAGHGREHIGEYASAQRTVDGSEVDQDVAQEERVNAKVEGDVRGRLAELLAEGELDGDVHRIVLWGRTHAKRKGTRYM